MNVPPHHGRNAPLRAKSVRLRHRHVRNAAPTRRHSARSGVLTHRVNAKIVVLRSGKRISP
jgi:hypothetical protein